MCEAADPYDYLRHIPFLVASYVHKCTEPGSYEKEIGKALVKSIQKDIDEAVRLLKEEKK